MITPNNFKGTDIECIMQAVENRENGVVVIPKRTIDAKRDYWLIDSAILLPENTTVILQNCKIKLSDKCRDNFFRSANCGMGIEFPERISNIHIKGEGLSILEGADHPRATGDGSKILACPCPKKPEDMLKYADWVSDEHKAAGITTFAEEHSHSYGTDALNPEESPKGDWRGIGVLFANVEDFSIENIRIVRPHGWAISMEACAYGRIEKIDFDSDMSREADGMLHNSENQDGIDLRAGCHNIIISDITGGTGDDMVALTAFAKDIYRPGGSLGRTEVMHTDWTKREKDIHDIIIRNVVGYSKGGICFMVRLLPGYTKIYNVVIDGIVDASPEGHRQSGIILLGEEHDGIFPDTMYNITISNVIATCGRPIVNAGFLSNSTITNVVNNNPKYPAIWQVREDGMKNVTLGAISSVSGKDVEVMGYLWE